MKLNFKELLKLTESGFIRVEKHTKDDLYIFGYYSDEPYQKREWNSLSSLCRGLITNGNGEIIEHPFPKFFTFKTYLSPNIALLSDSQIASIPNCKYRITEKIDGTMVILYWIGDIPYCATQRSFTNIKAKIATEILHEKYSHLFNKLDKRFTYIFEAVYPDISVLIDYGDTKDLFLIGIIDKRTGTPLEVPDIGFKTCRDFTSQYADIKKLNKLSALNIKNQEGFVIYYENGLMIKIKFPWYIEAHKALDSMFMIEKKLINIHKNILNTQGQTFPVITAKDVWNCIKSGDTELLQIRIKTPSYYNILGFDYWLTTVRDRIIPKINSSDTCPYNDIFNFNERIKEPHIHETIVWKWKERYL